jgi:hypothetical protein
MTSSRFLNSLIFVSLASLILFEVVAIEPLPRDMLRALFTAGAVYEGF